MTFILSILINLKNQILNNSNFEEKRDDHAL